MAQCSLPGGMAINWSGGLPRDVPGAIAVLREAIASGVNHIDTSDFYGPHVTNQLIKQALHPYPDDLVIVTKVGARRGSDGSWPHARSRQEIIDAVHDNLRNLGLDALDVVNLRLGGFTGPEDEPFEEPLTALAELKQKGLIRHLGLSTVSPQQLAEAQAITEIVCIQNFYNVAQRSDDGFIDALAAQGIAYVPYFPLGGFSPLQSAKLNAVAALLEATPMQIALAWLLRTISEPAADPWHIVGEASAREPEGCNAGVAGGNSCRPRQHWRRSRLEPITKRLTLQNGWTASGPFSIRLLHSESWTARDRHSP